MSLYLPPEATPKGGGQRSGAACTKMGTVFSIQAEEAVMEGAEHWPRFSAVSSSLEESLPELANMNKSPQHQKQHQTKKSSMLHKETITNVKKQRRRHKGKIVGSRGGILSLAQG